MQTPKRWAPDCQIEHIQTVRRGTIISRNYKFLQVKVPPTRRNEQILTTIRRVVPTADVLVGKPALVPPIYEIQYADQLNDQKQPVVPLNKCQNVQGH